MHILDDTVQTLLFPRRLEECAIRQRRLRSDRQDPSEYGVREAICATRYEAHRCDRADECEHNGVADEVEVHEDSPKCPPEEANSWEAVAFGHNRSLSIRLLCARHIINNTTREISSAKAAVCKLSRETFDMALNQCEFLKLHFIAYSYNLNHFTKLKL